MILRAIFWIALVSVLIPHEPDLGFGRPHMAGMSLGSRLGLWARETSTHPARMCGGHEAACFAGLALLDSLQGIAGRSLADVKADIEESQRERLLKARSG